MISAKKAKEKVIKSISKRSYIKKIKSQIEDAIEDGYFDCVIIIDEHDDIDTDTLKTLFHILRYFEYYGYAVTLRERTDKRIVIQVAWYYG